MFRRIFDKLRRPDKNKKNPISYVFFALIFAMIIFAFVFMDPGMMGGGSYGNSTAVKVGSSVVPISTYRQHMQALEQRMGFMLNSGNEQMEKMFRRRMQQQAINEIVNKELLTEMQNSEGLVVADGQISKVIINLDFLKEDGRFQRDRYHAFLANMGMTADRFEDSLRKDLRFDLLRELFNGSFKSPQAEQGFSDNIKDMRFQIDYVALSKDDFKSRAEVTDEQAEAFIADSNNLKSAQDYYSKNPSLFTDPEKVKAKMILILAEDGSEKSFSDAKRRLDEVSKDLKPENFSQIASEHSDDPTAADGGDLGYVEMGTYIPEWDQVAFNTSVGQISKPFKTGSGWVRLLIEEKTPATKKEFETVKLEVAKSLSVEARATEAIELLKTLAKESRFDEIEKTLKENGLEWASTPSLAFDVVSIPGIGTSERVVSSVLALKKDKDIHPDLIPVDGRNYLIRRGSVGARPETNTGQPQMVEARRVDYALSKWLEEKREGVNISVNPSLQEEMEN